MPRSRRAIAAALAAVAAAVAAVADPSVASAQWGPVIYQQAFHGCWLFGCSDGTMQIQRYDPAAQYFNVMVWDFTDHIVPVGSESAVAVRRYYPWPAEYFDDWEDQTWSNCRFSGYVAGPTTCWDSYAGRVPLDFDAQSITSVTIEMFIGPIGEPSSEAYDLLRPDERIGGVTIFATPEPATLAMVAGGLALLSALTGAGATRRRQRHQAVSTRPVPPK